MASGFDFDVKVTGVEKLAGVFKRDTAKAQRGLLAAVNEMLSDIFRESQAEVPYDEGILRASGNVEWPDGAGDVIKGSIFYGGPAAPYAVVQHEGEFNHPYPGTKRKYLEDPARRLRPKFMKQVVKEIERR